LTQILENAIARETLLKVYLAGTFLAPTRNDLHTLYYSESKAKMQEALGAESPNPAPLGQTFSRMIIVEIGTCGLPWAAESRIGR
jgi:hypothetical protein